MTGPCFICQGTTFAHVTSEYRRCVACGHETLVAGERQTFILNEPLSAAHAQRGSALERFQGGVLDRFAAGRSRRLLVDIGSGSGGFLSQQRDKFDRHCGLEITPAAVDFSRSALGLTMATSMDEIAGPIDVATAWHSLEHFPTAALERLLAQLAQKMPAGGLFLVSVPNNASFQYRIFRRRYAFFDVPNHLHQFSPDSLRRILRAHGFEPRASVLSWPYNVFGYTQALLNVLMPEHNYLYYRLKRGRPSRSGLLDALGLLLLPVVVPFAIVFSLADVIFPEKQGVLTYAFEKRP